METYKQAIKRTRKLQREDNKQEQRRRYLQVSAINKAIQEAKLTKKQARKQEAIERSRARWIYKQACKQANKQTA